MITKILSTFQFSEYNNIYTSIPKDAKYFVLLIHCTDNDQFYVATTSNLNYSQDTKNRIFGTEVKCKYYYIQFENRYRASFSKKVILQMEKTDNCVNFKPKGVPRTSEQYVYLLRGKEYYNLRDFLNVYGFSVQTMHRQLSIANGNCKRYSYTEFRASANS